MHIVVYGTGGAAGYFGARLAEAGEAVSFIARGEHLQAMQTSGLSVESLKGDMHIQPIRAFADPAQAGIADVVLLGVKTWQVEEAARAMGPLLGPETAVLPLQNGVEAPDQLAAILGPEHVLPGLAKIISFIKAPGHLCHSGLEPFLAFAEPDGTSSSRTEKLRQACEQAGIAAEIPEDIQAALWEKFLFVVAFGGVGAITGAPIGVLCSLPETRQMLRQAMQEIAALAAARGIAVPAGIVNTSLAFMDALPEGGTTSLQRDLAKGRPSELEAWNGAVVRLGREAGVATPLHAFIYHSLLPRELRSRGCLNF
ncbi:MAG: 2-dehydropantoate 2-reductase [Desulfohalobiaceae bacterium]|nr:2-dehydropantoate 2-reductase [Desulfohalobiaceae bacterium]